MIEENQGGGQRTPVDILQWRSGQSLQSLQPIYPLTHVEFMRMRGAPPRTETFSVNLLFAWLAFVITLLPRAIEHFLEPTKPGPVSAEWWIATGGLTVVVVIWVAGFLVKDPRKETFKKVEGFFAAAEAGVDNSSVGGME